MINIKNIDPIKIKTDKTHKKKILIYYFGYVTVKDLRYIKVNSVNPLRLINNKINGYFKEINRNKYLTLVATDESE